jgi:hypothetical protein
MLPAVLTVLLPLLVAAAMQSLQLLLDADSSGLTNPSCQCDSQHTVTVWHLATRSPKMGSNAVK